MEQSQIQEVNQQESLLWWLGGIIDGEGCITINHRQGYRDTKKEYLLFSPVIIITNTNKILIEKCQEILQSQNIPFYIQFKEKGKGRRIPCWWIDIVGIKRCLRALNILSQYLISKKEIADLVKEFCERRLAKNKDFNGKEGRERRGRIFGGNAPYDDKDFEIILRIAQIHNRNPQRLYAEIRDYKNRPIYKIERNQRGQFITAKQDKV